MELVEDYSRGSRSAKIFCVKDVAGCRCWDACLYLSRNDWDVEAALQSFYSTKVATQEAVKPAAWSSGGAKPLGVWLKRKEVDCPICVEKYAPGNKTIMTKCCFQVLCGKCYSRLTDSTGRFSCPFCRGADGLERDDIEEIDPPRLSRYRRMVEALTPPVDMQRLHRCHNGLKQLAPTCLLCVAVVVCNICAVQSGHVWVKRPRLNGILSICFPMGNGARFAEATSEFEGSDTGFLPTFNCSPGVSAYTAPSFGPATACESSCTPCAVSFHRDSSSQRSEDGR
eukprot:symbB.v1.2.003663.t1/scaffold175.1/size369221/19